MSAQYGPSTSTMGEYGTSTTMSGEYGPSPTPGYEPRGENPSEYSNLGTVPSLAKAHGTLMGLAFIVILPLGAFLVRFVRSKHAVWIHATCQLLGFAFVAAGLGVGVHMANVLHILYKQAHTYIGTIIFSLLFIQALLGYFHHWRYVATQKRTIWTFIHIWYGRVLVILGIINGGLGLQLAQLIGTSYSRAGMIVYSVLAGVIGTSLIALAMFGLSRDVLKKEEGEKVFLRNEAHAGNVHNEAHEGNVHNEAHEGN